MGKSAPTILQIIPRLDTGGAELSTIEITSAIVKAGGVALVATEGGRMAGDIVAAGGELVVFPAGTKNPARIIANGGALSRLIRERGVDLVHARSRAPAWSALIAARRTKIPFVTTYHGAYAEKGWAKRLYNSVMARADIVIANSQYTADLVRSRYGTSADRIRVIHRGVDLAKFDPGNVSAERIALLRKSWGITTDHRVILNAARLTNWKGQRVLIAAAAGLQQRGLLGDTVVILAGDAQGREDYVASLRADIDRGGLGNRVRLVGHVSDIAAAFATAHVAVVASIEPEAFGRAAAEAEAMACPVIATDIGAPRETVLAEPAVATARATGWLVPPGDAAALEGRLAEALHMDGDARLAMGHRARQHISDRFTLVAMKQSTLAVYDELLGTSLGPRLREAD